MVMNKFYVRALYKYHATQGDEISLHSKDVLLVQSVLDENWYIGQNYKRTFGAFPINYVERLSFPSFQPHEKLFFAISDFDAPEMGDLGFCKGDIIKGLGEVDENWWNGIVHGSKSQKPGIFPLTHVVEFDNEYIPDQTLKDVVHHDIKLKSGQSDLVSKNNILLSENVSMTSNLHSDLVKKGHKRSGSWYNQNNTKSLDSSVKPYAKTLYPYEAGGRDELSFLDNEIIYILEHFSGGWSRGKVDGKEGLFPINYVEIIVDCSPSVREVDDREGKLVSSNDDEEQKTLGTSTHYEEMAKNTTWDKELYGRALFNFSSTSSDQIDLKEGDTVTILKKVNDDWYRVRHDDGGIGLCPVTYVEVFGAEPEIFLPSGDHIPGNLAEPNHNSDIKVTSVSSDLNYQKRSDDSVSPTKPMLKPKPERSLMSEKLLDYTVLSDKKISPALDSTVQHATRCSDISISNMEEEKLTFNTNELVSQQLLIDNDLVMSDKYGSQKKLNISADDNDTRNKILSFNSNHDSVIKQRKPPLPPSPTTATTLSAIVDTTSSTVTTSTFLRFIPSRPAPSRPSALNKSSADNLIQFSPEHETTGSATKSLTISPSPPVPLTKTSIQGFSYLSSTSTIPIPSKRSMPRTPPRSQLLEIPPNPLESRKIDKKDRVVEELLKTETDYLQSLKLCRETFREGERTGNYPSSFDFDALFGNFEEVIELSSRLLESLEGYAHTPSVQHGNIGQCFLRLESDFKRVYAPYCRSHDNVLALLEKYEGDKDIQAFFKRMIDGLKEKIVVFDLASILIKPVQRILKYPLLLSELDKCIPENIPGKEDVTLAMQCMANIASYINESKRRQDLVSKYKQEMDGKLTDKIQKLNIHSTKKKLVRISQMIVGVQTVDEDFRREEQVFRALENLVKNLIRDFNSLIANSQECAFALMDLVEDIFSYHDNISVEMEIDSLKDLFEKVTKSIYTEFRVKVETEIIPSLNSLLIMFKGPSKVIKKRHDKLLDYENSIRQSGDVMSGEEQNIARSNYEALNAQLLDELPKLNGLSFDILTLLLKRFLQLKNTYQKDVSGQMRKLSALKFMAPEMQDLKLNVAEQFNIGHTAAVDLLSHYSFIPSTFNPNVAELKKSRRLTMDDSILAQLDFNPSQNQAAAHTLFQRYPLEKLFKVTKFFAGSQAMDVTVSQGAIVAVLKEGDPMGNRERWYIDDASTKGFILKSFLEPYRNSPKMSLHNPLSSPSSSSNLLDHLEPINCSVPTPPNSTNCSAAVLQSQLSALFAQSSCRSDSNFQQFHSPSPQSPMQNMSALPYLRSGSFSALPTYFSPSPSSPLTPHAAVVHSPTFLNNVFNPSVPSSSPPISSTRQMQPPHRAQQKKAMALFDFSARSDLELSTLKGQIYILVQTNDLTGNKEWWYLSDEKTGLAGYAPANYLALVHS